MISHLGYLSALLTYPVLNGEYYIWAETYNSDPFHVYSSWESCTVGLLCEELKIKRHNVFM